jgi:hypothetical protein
MCPPPALFPDDNDDDDAVAADARPIDEGREDGPLPLGPPVDAAGFVCVLGFRFQG